MADAKLVKRLRQGSDVWNAWRERRNTDVRLNLSGTNLNRADLSETNLRRADLSGAVLSGARLETTTFDNIDLQDYQSPWEARQGIREYLTYSNQ